MIGVRAVFQSRQVAVGDEASSSGSLEQLLAGGRTAGHLQMLGCRSKGFPTRKWPVLRTYLATPSSRSSPHTIYICCIPLE